MLRLFLYQIVSRTTARIGNERSVEATPRTVRWIHRLLCVARIAVFGSSMMPNSTFDRMLSGTYEQFRAQTAILAKCDAG